MTKTINHNTGQFISTFQCNFRINTAIHTKRFLGKCSQIKIFEGLFSCTISLHNLRIPHFINTIMFDDSGCCIISNQIVVFIIPCQCPRTDNIESAILFKFQLLLNCPLRIMEFDLFILDLMLPGTDGFEICKKIREVKNTPIIMVSAKKEDIDKIRGLGLGADDYITKPFSPSEMVARVKAHMARYERLIGSGQPSNEIVEIRGLKIDKTARRVWVNGEEKTFTTKEFDLLSFLAQNPNHVFTKEELFSKIWDMESIGDIATVTVHIKKIREKIEFNTAKPQYIETIWGVGYRFKV